MSALSRLPSLADARRHSKPCPKGQPRVLAKEDAAKAAARLQRKAMAAVRKRDGRICRVPGCKVSSTHTHHVLYRSKGGKDTTSNLVRLCQRHHRYVHAGLLRIQGDADQKLFWEGRT